jgi:hypothetical protein
MQLGVRIDGTRAGHPFKALVPICHGERMLANDAALGSASRSGSSLLGVTGVGCAIAVSVVAIPIAMLAVWLMSR